MHMYHQKHAYVSPAEESVQTRLDMQTHLQLQQKHRPGSGIKRRGCEGAPALHTAISSQGKRPAATGHNCNDACLMPLPVMVALSAVIVDPEATVHQANPDVQPDRCHGSNAHTNVLHRSRKLWGLLRSRAQRR